MVDVTDATFEAEVMNRSVEVPVVVDLWATWCGPCVQLGPIIERVVSATGGRVVLAKIDVDANPRAAATFKVQSIPAVFALKDRKIVNRFLGAQPEAVVQEFVDALLPTEEQTEVERLVEAGDERSLRAALELEPDNSAVINALAEMLVLDGRSDEGLALLQRIPETPEGRRIAALARAGVGATDDVEAKLTDLLALVKGDDDARQSFVDLLELLGPDDPRTPAWRKKLTTALF